MADDRDKVQHDKVLHKNEEKPEVEAHSQLKAHEEGGSEDDGPDVEAHKVQHKVQHKVEL